MEIYVRDLSTEAAEQWLDAVLASLECVREEPAATYRGTCEGEPVSVQVTETVQDGPFTSVWFRGEALPWEGVTGFAEAAHEATGQEVVCHLDNADDEPWRMLQVDADGRRYVDEGDIDFYGLSDTGT
jgi:hypothetical protein